MLIGSHAARLGLDYTDAVDNLAFFAKQVGMIENEGKTRGSNKDSTAKGLYQFVDGSVAPAINRLKKYIGMQPWMKKAVEHKDANKLTREQQTLLLLGDLLEKEGSDKYMRGVLSGDVESMRQAYLKLHHTNPDKATIKRVDRYLK